MANWRDSLWLGVASLGLALPVAAADRPVDQRVPLEANGTVAISNVAGTVTVEGWDRAEVRLTGKLGPGVERLDVRKDGDRLVVKVMLPRGSARDGGADLKLAVPRGAKLEISTVSADIEVLRFAGEQRISSVSGNAGLDVAAASVEVKTISGDVKLRGAGQPGRLRATSVSGDLRIERGAGTVEANSISGDLTLGLGPTQSLRLRSTSGDIRFSAAGERCARFDAESVSGDITVNLAAAAGFELEAESFSGDIGSCFGAKGARTYKMTPGNSLRSVRGDGGSRLRVKTMSGDISVCDRIDAAR